MLDLLELLMPFSMMITAVMLLVLNIIETKQEKEEAKMKKIKEAHDEIKKRWEEAEK